MHERYFVILINLLYEQNKHNCQLCNRYVELNMSKLKQYVSFLLENLFKI